MLGIFGVRPKAAPGSVASEFPAGTKMPFNQTNAPTGWTKDTTHNDKCFRVVSGAAGSGGATAFSSVFGAAKTTGSYALMTADIPAHLHAAGTLTTSSSGAHGHDNDLTTSSPSTFNAGEHLGTTASIWASGTAGGPADIGIVSAGAHTHTVTGSSANTGGDGGHTHTESLDLQFVDLIIATKN